MKKFISGIIVGVIISSTVAFAASYVANPAGFKVLVNGKEFTSDPPAMVINDRTYLPLRAIGDALGVPVNWNEELGQAEVGESSVASDMANEIMANVKYYEKCPGVPDFGATLGIKTYMPMVFSDGMYTVSYQNVEDMDIKVAIYCQILNSLEYKNTTDKFELSNENAKVFENDNNRVMVFQADGFLFIGIWKL